MTVRILVLVYVGFSLYLALLQQRVLYYPERADETELIPLAARNGLAPWRSSNGDYIGWQPASKPSRGAKQLWMQDGSGHNTLDYGISEPWWSEATAFLLAHAPPFPSAVRFAREERR